MGETATASARRASTAARTPGTASTGSIDTSGFDGAITTRRASCDGLQHAGGRASLLGAVEADGGDGDVVVALHEVLLEPDLALAGHRDAGLQAVVGDREEPQAEVPGLGDLARSPP